MIVLALDTATAATAVAVVALADDGEVLVRAEGRFLDPRAHGEQLAPHIHAALVEAEARQADLTAIVAGIGPGPFTGLRVGLATAVAIGQTLDIPTYGVCSLDGIGLATAAVEGPVLVATDARRREIYWALYARGERITDPEVSRPADIVPLLVARGVREAYGEGARRYRHVLELPVAEAPIHPDPCALVVRVVDRVAGKAPGEPLTPLYLRRPDAATAHPPKPATPAP